MTQELLQYYLASIDKCNHKVVNITNDTETLVKIHNSSLRKVVLKFDIREIS